MMTRRKVVLHEDLYIQWLRSREGSYRRVGLAGPKGAQHLLDKTWSNILNDPETDEMGIDEVLSKLCTGVEPLGFTRIRL